MPLEAISKHTNVVKSLNAWIRAKLVTIEGLTVHFEDEPDGTRPDSWIDVDYLFSLRKDFGRTVGQALGAWNHSILSLNLCLKRQAITNIYTLYVLRDRVIPYFLPTQSIPVLDYDTVGTPEIGSVICGRHTEPDVDDGRESGVIVRNISVEFTHTEAFSLV